jgi:hypothetical protein
MHQRFSTQLLSPNASNKVINILKQQGGGKCTGACLGNTRLLLLDVDHLMISLYSDTRSIIHLQVNPSSCELVHLLRHLGVDSTLVFHIS